MNIDELIDAYLLQELSGEQVAELRELLQGDPSARRRFVELVRVEARLHRGVSVQIPPSQRPPTPQPLVQRSIRALRRFDLVAAAVVAIVGVSLFYAIRPGLAPPQVAPAARRPNDRLTEKDLERSAEPQVIGGRIESVDPAGKTFVLVTPNEARITFRVATAPAGGREAAHLSFDETTSGFDEAIQANRWAKVTFLKVDDEEAWVWKVETTSFPE